MNQDWKVYQRHLQKGSLKLVYDNICEKAVCKTSPELISLLRLCNISHETSTLVSLMAVNFVHSCENGDYSIPYAMQFPLIVTNSNQPHEQKSNFDPDHAQDMVTIR